MDQSEIPDYSVVYSLSFLVFCTFLVIFLINEYFFLGQIRGTNTRYFMLCVLDALTMGLLVFTAVPFLVSKYLFVQVFGSFMMGMACINLLVLYVL